jgi:hypothetical protein
MILEQVKQEQSRHLRSLIPSKSIWVLLMLNGLDNGIGLFQLLQGVSH